MQQFVLAPFNNLYFIHMKKDNLIVAYFDGACAPTNPFGHMGTGCYVTHERERIFEHSGYVEASNQNSNNLAEYLALEQVLAFLCDQGVNDYKIRIFGDSMLVINQMNGQWGIKSGYYADTARHCLRTVKTFSDIKFTWIPREQNTEADSLSNAEFEKRGIARFDKSNMWRK